MRCSRAGVAASPGAAKGAIVFFADDAVAAAAEGREVVLVRQFTEAEDVAGFHAAQGVLTSEGGKASHAALVARGMGIPAVTGAGSLEIDVHKGEVKLGGEVVLREGDLIAIDGTTGSVTTDDVVLIDPVMSDEFRTILAWADELRRLDVRTNADTPEDAAKAREFGAQGIGLCRTEHMFFGEDRHAKMVEVILASSDEERRAGLAELLPLQQADFEGIFAAMDGLPVTIRLLDPPLHEFLPKLHDVEAQLERARVQRSDDLASLERTLRARARCRRSTRCSAHVASGSGSSTRRSTRCRSRRSSRPWSPRVAPGSTSTWRSWFPWSTTGASWSCCVG